MACLQLNKRVPSHSGSSWSFYDSYTVRSRGGKDDFGGEGYSSLVGFVLNGSFLAYLRQNEIVHSDRKRLCSAKYSYTVQGMSYSKPLRRRKISYFGSSFY